MTDMSRDRAPLGPEEKEGLSIPTIATRGELDRFEFENLRQALEWVDRYHRGTVLSEAFIRTLHVRMFGNIWRWAGIYRTVGMNIGVPVGMIHEELAKLISDARYWVDHSPMPHDEIGARFHYRLLWIHPFQNGNGRHGRLMTDLLLEKELGAEKFTWGGAVTTMPGQIRERYVEAMKEGDRGNLQPLIEFARS